MDIQKIRKLFPICNKFHYFQSAGLSPLPEFILQKYISNYKTLCNEGDFRWQNDLELLKETYNEIASFLNTSPENIAFVENNSLAMSLVALSLQKKHKNFNIVSLEEEFPSNTVPFEYLGINMRYVSNENHRYPVDSILKYCDSKTLAVVVSYVQYSTGFRLDIQTLGEELKKRGILFIVNATQAFPFYPIDMQKANIDVLTCSIHKWGFCGHIGTLFVTNSNFREQYPTPIAGWLSVDTTNHEDVIYTLKNNKFDVWKSAQQFHTGSFNIKNRIILKDVLIFVKELGLQNILNHFDNITSILINRLKKMNVSVVTPASTNSERSAIVSFTLDLSKNLSLVKYLEEKNIIVAIRNKFIRTSVNIFTNEDDVEVLSKEVERFIQQQ